MLLSCVISSITSMEQAEAVLHECTDLSFSYAVICQA